MKGTEGVSGGDLTFMGRMAAALSHEIRNLEAILREKAGLIEDLFAMGERTGSPDMARIRSLTGQFQEDLNRVETVTRDLSLLAHLPEKGCRDVGGGDLLRFALHRCQRTARSRDIRMVEPPEDHGVRLPAAPMEALSSLVSFLEAVVSAVPKGAVVTLSWHAFQGEYAAALRVEGLSEAAIDGVTLEASGSNVVAERASGGGGVVLKWAPGKPEAQAGVPSKQATPEE